MKTTMKTLTLTTLLALSTGAFAQRMSETAEAINAQTSITRAAIDNVITRMGNGRLDTLFNAQDYKDQAPKFQSDLDYAMNVFEDRLNKEIFPKAAFWMDQYNSIYASKEFSRAQKELLLKERLRHITGQFQSLSVKYQEILKELYSIIPNYDLDLDVKMRNMKFNSRKYKKTSFSLRVTVGNWSEYKRAKMYYNTANCPKREVADYLTIEIDEEKRELCIDRFIGPKDLWGHWQRFFSLNATTIKPGLLNMEVIQKSVFQNVAYQGIKGQCRSSICVGLRAADLSSLLTLLKSSIDQNISFKLADGNKVTLKALNQDISFIQKLMSRVDYPEDLPFDIQ